MSEFSGYLEQKLLDHAFGGAAYTPPANLYVALLLSPASDTDDCSTIVEPTTGGYARQEIIFDAAAGEAPAVKTNAGVITFTNSAATVWNVVGIAIVDSLAGVLATDKVLCFDNDMADASIGENEKLQFEIGGITVSLN